MKIAEINCVLPYRYTINIQKWYTCLYLFLDHFLKNLETNIEEWKEEIAHP